MAKINSAKTKWYWFGGVAIISMAIGLGIGALVFTKTITKEVPVKEKEIEKCDYSNWRSLKDADDKVIEIDGKIMLVSTEIIDAIKNNDSTATLNAKIKEFNDLMPQLEIVDKNREEILKKLGY